MNKRAADWLAFCAAVLLATVFLLWCYGCSQAIQPTEIIAATRTGDEFHDCVIAMMTVFAETAIELGDSRSGGLDAAGGGGQGSGAVSGGRDEQLRYQATSVSMSFEEFALITSVCAMTDEVAREFIQTKFDCARQEGCEFILDSKWIYEAALEIRKEHQLDN